MAAMTHAPFSLRPLALSCALLLTCTPLVWAAPPNKTEEFVLPNMCSIDNANPETGTADSTAQPQDCFEFGAALGELGLGWRKKLPQNVRWLTRKDALSLCKLAQSDLGKLVESRVTDGCVFLAPTVCTIVTAGHIAPASLSNAVRFCVP
jgi:hypothetical protein